MEKCIHIQLYDYLDKNSLLSPQQSGFRKSFSTRTCLINFLDKIFCNTSTSASRVQFIDLRKAFNTVDRSTLLSTLHAYGLKYPVVSWLKSYLEGRQQVTKVNNHISSTYNVSCGLPQGSILGPFLFTIYVNDLPDSIHSGSCYQNYRTVPPGVF